MNRIFLLILISTTSLLGQNQDNNSLFTLDQYLEWVRDYHPVMQQADLLEQQIDVKMMQAKGGFDPKLFGDYEHKSFDEKNYFRIANAGLKIPTWWGADIKLSYAWANGQYLNPNLTLPEKGQALIGVEVPLAQGLFFDQRRAQIEQAKLFGESNNVRQRAMINDLLFAASDAFLNWSYAYQNFTIQQSALALAKNRFQNIKASFVQGDKPAIDTLESMIQVQNREIILNEALVNLENKKLEMSSFLWFENLVPLEVEDNLKPEPLPETWSNPAEILSAADLTNHPELQAYALKGEALEIKRRLKKEELKPSLNVSYNFLGEGLNLAPETSVTNPLGNVLFENYKWGVHFNYPLFLRKERASLQLIQLEQMEVESKLENKELSLQNKILALIQAIDQTNQQLLLQQKMVVNYETLLSAENEKFKLGESSIFLINNREQKLFDAQQKLLKLRLKCQGLGWKLAWTKGAIS